VLPDVREADLVNAVPDITVVIEWENVLLCGNARSEMMLQRLAQQIRSLDRCVEVVVVCDPAGVGVTALGTLLTQHLGRADATPFGWRLVTAPGAHYYEFKNRGAAEARAPLIVLIDSDVIPEEGWLAALVELFADPAVHVVAGHSYIDAKGLYGRAMALGWFFPRRSELPTRHDRGTHFFANNVAFRTEMLRANPFACPTDGATRGACVALAQELCRQGIRIWVTTAAQVSHPPPNGLRHFLVRALADGRDEALHWRHAERRWKPPVPVFQRYFKVSRRAFRSIARHRHTVRLGLEQVPLACAIMGVYYGLACVSVLATWVAPGLMSRRFRI
jgi:hypothetical protein